VQVSGSAMIKVPKADGHAIVLRSAFLFDEIERV
jgi:hypothetical protein